MGNPCVFVYHIHHFHKVFFINVDTAEGARIIQFLWLKHNSDAPDNTCIFEFLNPLYSFLLVNVHLPSNLFVRPLVEGKFLLNQVQYLLVNFIHCTLILYAPHSIVKISSQYLPCLGGPDFPLIPN